ncbi:MAG: pilus assembly protein PilP [Gammaproteobacteria bacterium]|nr:pilus assembly protein PilP [Gammaproteobacteria bacterium]QOJ33394.1 MAG: pilus assembly protein PilP [Gammaproteobacteria bacterium]
MLLPLLALSVAGCVGGNDDLDKYINDVKARPGGRIEPLPQVKPYETFTYEAQSLRSPFAPDSPKGRANAGPRPEANRPKEYLEQFPLDTLKMVGTLQKDHQRYALLQAQDGLVHRVVPGNYVGQNDGRVVSVTEGEVKVEELVPDGIGGFYKRSAAIGLSD